MFESPRKTKSVRQAWSESQEELHETQPVSPVQKSERAKKKKKKRKTQQSGERSASAPQLNTETVSDTVCFENEQDESTLNNIEEPIVRGIFQIEKKSHDVVLTASRVTWIPIRPETQPGEPSAPRKEAFVELRDVFGVKTKRRRSIGQTVGGTLLGITLFYVRRKGTKLKDDELHLNNLSVDHCEVWFKHLKALLKGFKERPRMLKVFVNPVSHKKEALRIYMDDVAPLFKLADIDADLTVTERKGHALAFLQECSLEKYDGVVCVGGDGSVAEVAHGLLLRAQMDAGRDPDSVFTPVQAVLPLGVIPAGSTDIVSYSVHGRRHVLTAALHIIMGHRQAVDVCSFSSMGRLLRFGFSAMFGFGGRTLALAERHRWMPPGQRREFAMIKMLANLKPEDCELSFLPLKPAPDGTQEPAKTESSQDVKDTDEEGSWQTTQGLFLNISIMAIPCLCSMAPRGLAPNTRLNNGSMALILAKNTSRAEFVKHLKRYNSVNNQFSFPFVETHTVTAVKLRPKTQGHWSDEVSEEQEEGDSKSHGAIISSSENSSYPWNIDGDLLEAPSELHIRVHPQLLTLFGEDVEEVDESLIKCSCI